MSEEIINGFKKYSISYDYYNNKVLKKKYKKTLRYNTSNKRKSFLKFKIKKYKIERNKIREEHLERMKEHPIKNIELFQISIIERPINHDALIVDCENYKEQNLNIGEVK